MKRLFIIIALVTVSNTALAKTNFSIFSNVDVYLTNGTVVNGGVEYPIDIYQESVTVQLGKHSKKNYSKDEITKLVFKIAGSELVMVKLKHNHTPIYEKNDDEIFVQEFAKGKVTVYQGYNTGYKIKKRKSTLVNDTNLWFCKKDEEQTLQLLYAETNNTATVDLFKQNAQKYFNSTEIINYISESNFSKLIQYVKSF